MSEVFIKLFNLSVMAGWIVLAVVLLRLIFKKAPKWINCLLWGIVGLRLIFPFSLESVMSLIPSAEPLPPDITVTDTPAINSGFTVIDRVVNPVISGSLSPSPGDSANPMQIIVAVASYVWVIGLALMLLYGAISYLRLWRKVCPSILYKENIYHCDNIDTPFILGSVKPKIYVPSGIRKEDMMYVIEHEKAHLRRKDHWWKPLGFLLLAVYWFNPLIWIAYLLLCRDIEKACDEKVIKSMDNDAKKGYSEALVACSIHRRLIMACPLAFGEVGVKDRIKSVLNYKKPAFWIMIAAIVAGAVVAICFLTNPRMQNETDTPGSTNSPEKTDMILPTSITHTDYEGVYLSFQSINSNQGGYPVLNLIWHNETNVDFVFGEAYTIEYLNGAEWEDVKFNELNFGDITNVLSANSTRVESYSTKEFDISKEGMYRLRIEFGLDNNQYTTWIEFQVRPSKIPPKIPQDIIWQPSRDVQDYQSIVQRLEAEYPEYFHLSTSKGLEVYVWQMAADSYSCVLLPGVNRRYTVEDIMRLKSVSIAEMRVILSTYDIANTKLTILPYPMPHSDYYYVIDEAYQRFLHLLFGGVFNTNYTPIKDAVEFDIDGDQENELCLLGVGATSGIVSFSLATFEVESHTMEFFSAACPISVSSDLSFHVDDDGMVGIRGYDRNSNEIFLQIQIKDGVIFTRHGESVSVINN